jgi:soluble lytic murein transglycosylase-like protein
MSNGKPALVLLFMLTAMLPAASSVLATDKTYVYKEADGTLWYTNVTPTAQDLTQFTLIEVRGRGPATASCRGMNSKKLEHRALSFNSIIERMAREFRVDAKLVKAVVRNESCFDKMALSRAGAQGLMQLMPATAESLGVVDPFDAEQNIRGGTKYLSRLIKKYDNNLALALSAYNAGPGSVAKHNGVPPFPETQRYIERVMKTYREYLRISLASG